MYENFLTHFHGVRKKIVTFLWGTKIFLRLTEIRSARVLGVENGRSLTAIYIYMDI